MSEEMDMKATILIVDDDPNLTKTLSDILRLQGYTPLVAAEGKTALNRVKNEVPAIALIDLKLPDMDGLEVMREIKERSPGTECVVLTGYASQASAIEAVNLGAYGYMQKPYDVEQLVLTIRRAIEKREAEEELEHTLEKLRKALGGIIQAMALIVESRDPYTAGHQRRATNLARAIATKMGLSEEQIDGIRMAGVVHDLGKISVPAGILNKPGRLTENEFAIIQTHAQVAYDILKTIEFPWPVAQIVLQHHERLDGSGYPAGLKGDEIMLEARILAVADVIEAMCSHRPYRPALSIDEALGEIRQNRGVRYDPEVVDACLSLFSDEGFELEHA